MPGLMFFSALQQAGATSTGVLSSAPLTSSRRKPLWFLCWRCHQYINPTLLVMCRRAVLLYHSNVRIKCWNSVVFCFSPVSSARANTTRPRYALVCGTCTVSFSQSPHTRSCNICRRSFTRLARGLWQ